MNVFPYILFGFFVVISIVEIIAAFNEFEVVRKIVKPFSLFFLALAALSALPLHPLIYIGAFLGMIGENVLHNLGYSLVNHSGIQSIKVNAWFQTYL